MLPLLSLFLLSATLPLDRVSEGAHIHCVAAKAELTIDVSEKGHFFRYSMAYDGTVRQQAFAPRVDGTGMNAQSVSVSKVGDQVRIDAQQQVTTLVFREGYARAIEGTRNAELVHQPGLYAQTELVHGAFAVLVPDGDGAVRLAYFSDSQGGDHPGLYDFQELNDARCTIEPIY